MVPYWALFGLVLRHVILNLEQLWQVLTLMLLLLLIPWFAFILPEAYRPESVHGEWYAVHRHGSTLNYDDILVIFFKFQYAQTPRRTSIASSV